MHVHVRVLCFALLPWSSPLPAACHAGGMSDARGTVDTPLPRVDDSSLTGGLSVTPRDRSTPLRLDDLRLCRQLSSSDEAAGGPCSGWDVWLAQESNPECDALYVVKRIPKHRLRSLGSRVLSRAHTERRVLVRLTENESSTGARVCPRIRLACQTNSHLYMVSDYCAGGDLAGLLAAAQPRLPESLARTILRDLSRALTALHAAGIMHRDLKPSNIVLDACGHVRLIDFGLSALEETRTATPPTTDAEPTSTALFAVDSTLRMSAVGSHAYVSPEVILGIGHDHRTDLWSLGAAAFELLCGRRAFPGSDQDALDAIIDADIDWPTGCRAVAEEMRRTRPTDEEVRRMQAAHVAAAPVPVDPPRDHSTTALDECILSPAAISFVLALLTIDPSHRRSALDLESHPFLAGDAKMPTPHAEEAAREQLRAFAAASASRQNTPCGDFISSLPQLVAEQSDPEFAGFEWP